ncbi:hypothetical protein BC628DRAFT_1420570 [Trametes gibbosa]|nr:hypothetical protein BC628DRAFT_1420570 [Trametes gibbosa]
MPLWTSLAALTATGSSPRSKDLRHTLAAGEIVAWQKSQHVNANVNMGLSSDPSCPHGQDLDVDMVPMDVYDAPISTPHPSTSTAAGVRHTVTIEDVPDVESGGLPHRPWIEDFPEPAAQCFGMGETPFERTLREQRTRGDAPFAPFEDLEEWDLAQWLVTSGVTQASIDRFLKLDVTRGRTKPSFESSYMFHKKVDALPGGTASWKVEVLEAVGDKLGDDGKARTERLELWLRDPVDCVRDLLGNSMLRDSLTYAPERHYADAEGKNRVYENMWTGDWWWDVQAKLPDGATIAPVILASDKTTLSRMSGDKSAWPVYLTLGNIAKAVRRRPSAHATILLGYLPVAKLECFSKKRRALEGYRLFHLCMTKMLAPLVAAGRDGVRMTCADGRIRHVHPILAAYIADHPEQCLVAACQENFCPKCPVPPDQRGEPVYSRLKDPARVRTVMKQAAEGLDTPPEFTEWGLRAVEPFWEHLPHADIFTALTPDLLHQLHKGVFKEHLVSWVIQAMPGGANEVDSRFKAMLKHSDLRHFKNGISLVSQWTGTEFKNMEKVFLGVVAGAADERVVRAVRAVLDFIYLAHFEAHTDQSLNALHQAWRDYHHYKSVFIELEIREHFNFPKGHSMEHYEPSIRSSGTADGYSTEHPERLHIDFAKLAYGASNKQATYIQQMTRWLERQEAVYRFSCYLGWAATQPGVPSAPAGPQAVQSGPAASPPHARSHPAAIPSNTPSSSVPSLALSGLPNTSGPGPHHTAPVPQASSETRPAPAGAAVCSSTSTSQGCTGPQANALSIASSDAASLPNETGDELVEENPWKDGYRIAKVPPFPSLTVTQLVAQFGATHFKSALNNYLKRLAGIRKVGNFRTDIGFRALRQDPKGDVVSVRRVHLRGPPSTVCPDSTVGSNVVGAHAPAREGRTAPKYQKPA